MSYLDFIEKTRFIRNPEVTFTTGDPEYPGTALEVYDKKNKVELFHFVVDGTGERQLLVFGQGKPYRISLDNLEELIKNAKEQVSYITFNS